MSLKCTKKLFLTFALAILFILLLSISSFAMTPTWTNDAKFTRGVSNTCYYISSSASSYTSKINAAAQNWEVTGYGWNPIYVTAVSSNRATHIDIYSVNPNNDTVLDDNTNAYASFWSSSSTLLANRGYGPSTNYFYTEIAINSSKTLETDTFIHEMGHCFGLAHSSDRNSIMYGTKSKRNVSTVQKDDHDTINYLYN